MQHFILMASVLMLMSSSCDTDCNDCGPTGHTRYYIKNSTNEDFKLYWFGNTTLPSHIAHEFVIPAGERLLIYESSLTGTSGPISTPPFNSITPYDSIKLELVSRTVTYLKGDCDSTRNPLCEDNYELITSIDTKKQKIKEWEFEIE